MLKKFFIILLTVFVIIQFVRPEKNNNTVITDHDITRVYTVPDSVQQILKASCYDCHSNNTRYPWYFKVQPVAAWMHHHIQEAKTALNFSDFGSYNKEGQEKKLKKIANAARMGWMPLYSYTWIHRGAILTKKDRTIIAYWAARQAQDIATQE